MYILRKLIDLARDVKKYYIKSPRETIEHFKQELLKIIDTLVEFFNPKDLDYEKLLCSTYVFSECCEGILYEAVKEKIEEQDEYYEDLDITSPEQMFACLEINFPHTYTYHSQSKFLFLDAVHNTRIMKDNLPQFVLELLNHSPSLHHGTILFDYITGQLDDQIQRFEELGQIQEPMEVDEEEVKEEVKEEVEKEVEKEVVEEVEKEEVEKEEVEVEDVEVKDVEKEDVEKEEVEVKEEKEVEPPPKKKRGRPKKNSTTEETTVKKKRGRPKKVN